MAQIIPVDLFDIVVFGGTGDLALRKLMPSLFLRDRDAQIPAESRIFGVSRSDLTSADYTARLRAGLERHLDPADLEEEVWQRFSARITHVKLDATKPDGWDGLVEGLKGGEERARVFYLATSPDLFGPICHNLKAAGVVTPQARVVLEKPIGRDLDSACRINDEVGTVFSEDQIFRIDHYLGKETVQNLMALRFANSLFEPLWTSASIDHIQITVAEKIGVEGRGGYYDRSGALRDMVQNHLLQLLCLVAMEPPVRLDKDSVRDEKLKVLQALRPIAGSDIGVKTVSGQYRSGAVDGHPVPAYQDELDSDEESRTETFVVIKAEVENWRWAGVPFYLRTGKRMPKRSSEIIIQFRPVPHSIFEAGAGEVAANRLVIRLQPDEGVTLNLMTKDPGPGGLRLRSAPLNLSFAETFKVRYPDAYERLLMDVVRGNPTLFMRRDEVEAAWSWVEPILAGWESAAEKPKAYTAGTWGPSAAIALIERDGRTWHDDNE